MDLIAGNNFLQNYPFAADPTILKNNHYSSFIAVAAVTASMLLPTLSFAIMF